MNKHAERFWEKVEKGDDCWIWTGARTSAGYGNFIYKGKNAVAHRLSYTWLIGEIPEGLDLDHLCRVRRCVNPEHLEPVTRAVNLLRGKTIPAKHAAKTHCPSGHEYSAENTYVCKKGSRHCKECRRITSNKYYHEVIKVRNQARSQNEGER